MKYIFCQYRNVAEVYIEVHLCLQEYNCSNNMGSWFVEGHKYDLIVCFHKQVSSDITEHLCVKDLNLSQ